MGTFIQIGDNYVDEGEIVRVENTTDENYDFGKGTGQPRANVYLRTRGIIETEDEAALKMLDWAYDHISRQPQPILWAGRTYGVAEMQFMLRTKSNDGLAVATVRSDYFAADYSRLVTEGLVISGTNGMILSTNGHLLLNALYEEDLLETYLVIKA